MRLSTTCCICAEPMGVPGDNPNWPCCSDKCENTYCDIQYEASERMRDMHLAAEERGACPYGWNHL